MHWFKVDCATLREGPGLKASDMALGAWLRMTGYCASQENGGLIPACAEWGEVDWLRSAGCTLASVKEAVACGLCTEHGSDLRVEFFDHDGQERVAQLRRQARDAALKRWGKHPDQQDPDMPDGMPDGNPDGMPSGNARNVTDPTIPTKRRGASSESNERKWTLFLSKLCVPLPNDRAAVEWYGLATNEATCPSLDDCMNFMRWAVPLVRKREGNKFYAADAIPEAREWKRALQRDAADG